MIEVKRKRAGTEGTKLYVVSTTEPQPPNVPGGARRFVPRVDRKTWHDTWRARQKSLMGLVRSNRGYSQLAIEDAIRDHMDALDAQRKRLERQVEFLTRAA